MTFRLQRYLALWWLVLAVVLAPMLGRMHQVLHASGLRGAVPLSCLPGCDGNVQVAAGSAGITPAVPSAGPGLDALHALFVGHGGSDCQLLDQQLLGSALLPSVAVQIRVQFVPPLEQTVGSSSSGRRLQAFLARGPPAAA